LIERVFSRQRTSGTPKRSSKCTKILRGVDPGASNSS
jgi:hypothetical protein